MKLCLTTCILSALLSVPTLAYPAFGSHLSTSSLLHGTRPSVIPRLFPNVEGLKKVPDDQHPFVPPGPTDQRGPCPGLNVLANHGYIPRNGIASLEELVFAMEEAFNLGPDLGTALTALAIALTGSLHSRTFSIGSADSRVPGKGRGADAHNAFETDASLTRLDYYLNRGDDFSWDAESYIELSDVAAKMGDYSLSAVREAHYRKFMKSKTTNPYWYNMPPSAVISIGAAAFVPRCYANGTYGDGGVADDFNVDIFYGSVAHNKERSNFTWVQETFPPSWFRSGQAYGLREVVEDIVPAYLAHPDMLEYGANAGSVDNFVALGIEVPLDIDGFGCFLYNAQLANLPNQLAELTTTEMAFIVSTLDGIVGPYYQAAFGCGAYQPNSTLAAAFSQVADALSHGI